MMKRFLLLLVILSLSSCKGRNSDINHNKEEPTPSLEKATVVSYENIDVKAFEQAINTVKDAVIIDVRTPEETQEGVIEGAIELNFYDKDFADKLLALDKEKSYYLYCKAGGRSAKTARLMVKNGFKSVFNLEGGYTLWSSEKK